MNSTNRALNRSLVLVTGLLLLAIGVTAVVLGTVEAARDAWADAAATVHSRVEGVFAATALGATGVSWLYPVIALIAAAAVAVLLVFIVRQGGGRTTELVRDESTGTPGSVVVVDAAVAEQSLQHALSARPELVSATVTTYRVTGIAALNVSVSARPGVSPRAVSEIVDEHLRALDLLLGTEVPALLHLRGGIRTRTTAATRVE